MTKTVTEANIFEALADAWQSYIEQESLGWWRQGGGFTLERVRQFSDETAEVTPEQFKSFDASLGKTRCLACAKPEIYIEGNCFDCYERGLED